MAGDESEPFVISVGGWLKEHTWICKQEEDDITLPLRGPTSRFSIVINLLRNVLSSPVNYPSAL